MPQTRVGLEAIARQQLVALVGDQVHRIDDVVERLLVDEVVEVDTDPAGLDALAASIDLALELMRAVEIDAQQPMPVRTGARAAAT